MSLYVNGYSIFLVSVFIVINAKGSEIKGAFVLLAKGHRLRESLIKETKASNAVHCIQQCLQEGLHYVSINYGKTSEAKGRCQLNGRTATGSNMANLVADENFDYFEKDMGTEQTGTCRIPENQGVLGTGKCDAPEALGMESGKIQDSAITASSYFRAGWEPYTARLRKHIGRCAWAPYRQGGEWLQVDLGLVTIVTAIATQGRCEADAWVKTYMISYSNDAQNWSFYNESGSKKIFTGNTDRNTDVNNSFDPHIHARYMRILPQSWHNGNGDVRIEYYGCPYKN